MRNSKFPSKVAEKVTSAYVVKKFSGLLKNEKCNKLLVLEHMNYFPLPVEPVGRFPDDHFVGRGLRGRMGVGRPGVGAPASSLSAPTGTAAASLIGRTRRASTLSANRNSPTARVELSVSYGFDSSALEYGVRVEKLLVGQILFLHFKELLEHNWHY